MRHHYALFGLLRAVLGGPGPVPVTPLQESFLFSFFFSLCCHARRTQDCKYRTNKEGAGASAPRDAAAPAAPPSLARVFPILSASSQLGSRRVDFRAGARPHGLRRSPALAPLCPRGVEARALARPVSRQAARACGEPFPGGGRAARRGVAVGNVPARAGVRGGCTRVNLWFEEGAGEGGAERRGVVKRAVERFNKDTPPLHF